MFAEQPSVKLSCQLCCSVFKDPVITTCGVSGPASFACPVVGRKTGRAPLCPGRACSGVVPLAKRPGPGGRDLSLEPGVQQEALWHNGCAPSHPGQEWAACLPCSVCKRAPSRRSPAEVDLGERVWELRPQKEWTQAQD